MFPEMNAHFLGDKIRRFSDVNIGVAVDTPKGLMVPVIHSADKKSLKEISDELRILAAKCREGSASPEELSGGTFTVTNLGAFGIESFTPVLNAPEVGILGVCSISPRAVTKKGETHFVPHIGLSLTIDHQAVDGAPGARFLAELSRRMGSFETLAAL
jgi:pyruvate dehydrogenase E2 component (dihydrolipoamide acetyltransferase)